MWWYTLQFAKQCNKMFIVCINECITILAIIRLWLSVRQSETYIQIFIQMLLLSSGSLHSFQMYVSEINLITLCISSRYCTCTLCAFKWTVFSCSNQDVIISIKYMQPNQPFWLNLDTCSQYVYCSLHVCMCLKINSFVAVVIKLQSRCDHWSYQSYIQPN